MIDGGVERGLAWLPLLYIVIGKCEILSLVFVGRVTERG